MNFFLWGITAYYFELKVLTLSKFIIGMTGAFGSGCSMIAKTFIANGVFKYISLSEYLKRLYQEEYGVPFTDRKQLQDYGDKIRSEKGIGILAEMVIHEIEETHDTEYFVVDSIRNPGEIEKFRSQYPDFYLFGIFADKDKRWDRVHEIYKDNLAEFNVDEKRDKGLGESAIGQNVSDCFYNADAVISNNDVIQGKNEHYKLMKEKVSKYVELFKNPGQELPNDDESIMAMAYANGLRSHCLKRKVGAVIIDQFGNSFSSGYNEVPIGEKTCEEKHDGCYRDYRKEELSNELAPYINDPKNIKKAVSKFKILDLCRSLHAEENAIINIARFGSSSALMGATLYTTTYPCNLCANKIAQVGIKKIVYFEPYPVIQARATLDRNNVEQKPFEGVTFRSYFKVFKQCE